jgi:hypothetical protein
MRRLVEQLRPGGLTTLLTLPSVTDIECTRLTLAGRDENQVPSTEVADFYLAYFGVTRMKSENLLDIRLAIYNAARSSRL